MSEKIIDVEFEDSKKSYMIKDIPSGNWREFKIKLLQDGFDTYNQALLYIIKEYTERK